MYKNNFSMRSIDCIAHTEILHPGVRSTTGNHQLWSRVSRIVPIPDQPNSKYTGITTTQNAFDLDLDTPKVMGTTVVSER